MRHNKVFSKLVSSMIIRSITSIKAGKDGKKFLPLTVKSELVPTATT